jgi:hypothetical protein
MHIPGPPKGHSQENEKFGLDQNPILGGGAQFVRTCSGKDLPHGDKNKFYLLRPYGQVQWEMWDVTNPSKPARMNIIIGGLHDTHKPWWECDTGIAYLVGGPNNWRVPPAGAKAVHDVPNHTLVYDLSDPANPKLVREFGLPGQEPGSTAPLPLGGLHNILSTGPKGNRVYLTYGNNSHGVVQILDREQLLNGPKEPTPENLRYPEVARIDLPPDIGAHTALPLPQILVPEFVKQKEGKVRDFLALVGQVNGVECLRGTRQMMYMFDVTTESRPLGMASFTVEEASGDFCSRGGRFGFHSTQENFTDIYNKRVLFITAMNAGVRAVDIRDPYHPKEIGYYIPATTDLTDESCAHEGSQVHCARAIQTNNVEVDDRGFIYITDRANTGMHILELTGSARTVANFTRKSWSPPSATQAAAGAR